ncbi:hypothetical protein [Prosthecobacter sp. SYSU 5D2]|uniref:hypothetical protein n=1 Tax=Prosthecobacter sp. SYSU 5D2 TaxID=3134134 RepID=UPI0031FF40BE
MLRNQAGSIGRLSVRFILTRNREVWAVMDLHTPSPNGPPARSSKPKGLCFAQSWEAFQFLLHIAIEFDSLTQNILNALEKRFSLKTAISANGENFPLLK